MGSKSEIKKRMVAAAAKAWGISNRDIDKIDPLIPFLIDACASEIEKISFDIYSNREKMSYKLMELLTPSAITSPYPARAIAYAQSMDAKCMINENNQFFYEKRKFENDEEKEIDIYFTPTSAHQLIKGQIDYIAFNDSIYLKENPFENDHLCNTKPNQHLDPNSMWIGLNVANSVDSIDGISFYFELNDIEGIQEKIFYQALSSSSWVIDDQILNKYNGFHVETKNRRLDDIDIPVGDFTKSRSVCYHLNNFYKKYFITIGENKSVNYRGLKQRYPESFKDVFMDEDLKKIEGNLIWIKIDFSHHVSNQILEKLNCSINCFPVINRRVEKVVITGKDKIIGMDSEAYEMFFDLKNIQSDEQLKVVLTKNHHAYEEGKAMLTLRQDNIGRASSRNALEIIQQLINTYREEFSAFSKFKEINQDAIENLGNALRPFENTIENSESSALDAMPYLMLKTDVEKEDIAVEVSYWLTNGSLANDIPKEDHLRYDSAELARDEIYLMTTSYGGINPKSNDELVHDFRYALLTRNRIVTKADIKALCYKIFENNIEEVLVTEEVLADPFPDSGLRKVIKIDIILQNNTRLNKEEIKFLKEDIETHLTEKSMNILPFVVSVN